MVVSPHRTDAAQKKSTRLKGGKNPPFCGALPWPCADLQLAYLSKVAALCLGKSPKLKKSTWLKRGKNPLSRPQSEAILGICTVRSARP